MNSFTDYKREEKLDRPVVEETVPNNRCFGGNCLRKKEKKTKKLLDVGRHEGERTLCPNEENSGRKRTRERL